MVLRNLCCTNGWIKTLLYSQSVDNIRKRKDMPFLKMIDRRANWGGRITIDAHGVENIPEEDGFISFPNHQGLYDVLQFLMRVHVLFQWL